MITAEEFWLAVDVADDDDDCWEWTMSTDRYGYGQVWWDGELTRSHRKAWKLAVGPIPDGLHILHSCDNPPCCNPFHLRPGTQADNNGDTVSRERHWQTAKTHCAQGHEFSEANTYQRAGHRTCRTCNNAASRRYRARTRNNPRR